MARLHGVGHLVGIENGAAIEVAGGPADGLDKRSLRAQESFLIGVEDGDKRDFGQIEAFAQEVDADQDVVFAFAQIAQELMRSSVSISECM